VHPRAVRLPRPDQPLKDSDIAIVAGSDEEIAALVKELGGSRS
jgi:Trk K+ transport system NAD-binding subunit